MRNYNTHLSSLREKLGLSIKQASKLIGISRMKLYFYEAGYFRPTQKDLEKINAFYKEDVKIDGIEGYPVPNLTKEKHKKDKRLKGKRIVFGIFSVFSLLIIATGSILFSQTLNNELSFYGEAYNQTKAAVVKQGLYAHDLVTSMKYYYAEERGYDFESTMLFYESNNILYFNECTYSRTYFNGTMDLDRYLYHFGSNLGIDSYRCDFTYGALNEGAYFSCSFDYTGGKVEKIYNLKTITEGIDPISEKDALYIVNSKIDEVNPALSELMSALLDQEYDFYHDFLPAREKGRKINFALQISGLILIFTGITMFFIFFTVFIKLLLKNVKPRLVSTDISPEGKAVEPLPEDINVRLGVPDIFIIIIGKVCQYLSMLMLALSFLTKVGLRLPSFFVDPTFASVFGVAWLVGIFLEHFVMIGRIKKAKTLFQEVIRNLMIFLFIATIETLLIVITNAWGYDFASLIFKYIPGNVYQVVAVHYLLFLFLFFQPSFLNKLGTKARVLWHSLSILPLGFLITSYILSNRYALVYGVKENVYINFWFPNSFLLLSIVCVLFIYITFFLRLFYEKKYGKHNSQLFFYGDRYALIENLICVALIIIATSLDFIFMHNQFAYYLGLGRNYWMYILVPFLLVCKYSPNSQQAVLLEDNFVREVVNE